MSPRRAVPASRRWRVLGGLSLAAAVAAAGSGVAYSYFTTTATGTGTALVGTVSLQTTTSKTCNYNFLSPGDLTSASTCVLAVAYTGSVAAYVSLSVAVQSKAGPGGTPLYDGTNSSGLTLSITDGHHSFSVPTGAGTIVTCPAGYTCWTSVYDLAASYSGATPSLTFANGGTATWTLTPLFPTSVTNSYQGGTATVTLTAQAVQAAANPLPPSCTTSTIGQPCSGSGFSWS